MMRFCRLASSWSEVAGIDENGTVPSRSDPAVEWKERAGKAIRCVHDGCTRQRYAPVAGSRCTNEFCSARPTMCTFKTHPTMRTFFAAAASASSKTAWGRDEEDLRRLRRKEARFTG